MWNYKERKTTASGQRVRTARATENKIESNVQFDR